MPYDAPFCHKRSVSDAAFGSMVDGDHRKRRRNRTTQSCLNCYRSKRMCDRKRPCSRCTHLGLTGICIYEVDDPNREEDNQDENSRLKKRVAELEGVIRQLKNKPHPSWTQEGRESDRQGVRSLVDLGQTSPFHPYSASSPLALTLSPLSDYSDTSAARSSVSSPTADEMPATPVDARPVEHTLNHGCLSFYNTHSPLSPNPTDEYFSTLSDVSAEPICMSSLFLPTGSSAGITPFVDNDSRATLYHPSYNSRTQPVLQTTAHCACLSSAMHRDILSDLSSRLHKASVVLSRAPCHQIGSTCLVYQRVAEIDKFTRVVLGGAPTLYDQELEPRGTPDGPTNGFFIPPDLTCPPDTWKPDSDMMQIIWR